MLHDNKRSPDVLGGKYGDALRGHDGEQDRMLEEIDQKLFQSALHEIKKNKMLRFKNKNNDALRFHPINDKPPNNQPIGVEKTKQWTTIASIRIQDSKKQLISVDQSKTGKANAPISFKESTEKQSIRAAKCAVVVYLPQNVNYVYQFVTMLYGSWKYINNNKDEIFNSTENLNTIDLLVFAHQNIFSELPTDCKILDRHSNKNNNGYYDNTETATPTCWKVHQEYETKSVYKNLNSFIMFLQKDISQILFPYTYVLRTDIDVFLTPKFYSFRPTLDVVTGIGGYSNQFNQQRLRSIAKTLHLNHNAIHNIGSSWYGRTQAIIRLSKQAYNLSEYLYDNEFKPNLLGLDSIDFVKNPNGKWPTWYKLTASMYGSELAINDGVRDFSFENFEHFDTSTCNPNPVWTHYQLHAYHTECEFNKARFMNVLTEISAGTSLRHRELKKKLKAYSEKSLEDIHNRNCTDYATFIAWHSAGKYLDFNAIFRIQ